MHILIAKNAERWSAWLREAASWSQFSNAQHLERVVDTALDLAFKTTPSAVDLTFSTKQVADVSIVERPEELAAVDLGAAIEALMPEGRFDGDDRWAAVQRDARTGRMWSFGIDDTFRQRALKDRIVGWFGNYRSFGPPNPRYPDDRPPPWERELLVRHGDDWQARRICPDAFPEFKAGPTITAEQQAKRLSKLPQHRSATRRAKLAENDRRFKAEAVERARAREAVE